jgi:hypothetical protein
MACMIFLICFWELFSPKHQLLVYNSHRNHKPVGCLVQPFEMLKCSVQRKLPLKTGVVSFLSLPFIRLFSCMSRGECRISLLSASSTAKMIAAQNVGYDGLGCLTSTAPSMLTISWCSVLTTDPKMEESSGNLLPQC